MLYFQRVKYSCVLYTKSGALYIHYVTFKDQKEFIKNLKLVYQVSTKELAEEELLKLEEKWSKKYPLVINS